jgi:hypothetical protein
VVVVSKVDDRGTKPRGDDRRLGGARFEIRPDDGDGQYEPRTDDATVLFAGVAEDGFYVLPATPATDFWVVEADAPRGYGTAEPQLVRQPLDTDANCTQRVGKPRRSCTAADDPPGGTLTVVVADSPAKLPPTDTRASER